MSENQDFDSIIKSKFSEQEFPFDEANWDDAEDMIYTFRKKERIKRVAFIFSAGLILGILIMLPFVVIKQEEIAAPVIIKDDNIAANTIQQDKLRNSVINKDDIEDKNPKEIETKEKIVNTSKKNTESIGSFKAKSGRASSMLAANKGNVENKTGSGEVASQVMDKQETASEKEIESATALQQVESDSITAPLEIAANTPQIKLDSLVTVDSLTVIKDSLIAATDTVLAADSVNNVADKADSTKNKNLSRPIFVEAYVGGSYVRQFGLNPFQGITVYFPLIKDIAIGTGAGYTFLSASSNTVKTIVTDITYDLGYTSDVTEIKTDKIHYFMLPLHIQYNVDEKSALLIGAVNYFMTTVSNTYSTYKESYGEKNNVNSQKTYGYSSGINSYDIALIVGCKRTLFNNLGISAYFTYGLTDIKKNAYYINDHFDRNISGQLLLTYKLR